MASNTPSAAITQSRRRLASAFLLFVLAGHAFDVVFKRDDWPFSQYDMFKLRQDKYSARDEVVGVTADGVEVPIDVSAELMPFDPSRLRRALIRLREEQGPEAQRVVLTKLIARYAELRVERGAQGPDLVGLRIYANRWLLTAEGSGPRRVGRKKTFDTTLASKGRKR